MRTPDFVGRGWAKARHAPLPSPMERLVTLVIEALDERADLPHAVVGVVGPYNVRVHFLSAVAPDLRVVVRDAVARRLPVPVVIEISARS